MSIFLSQVFLGIFSSGSRIQDFLGMRLLPSGVRQPIILQIFCRKLHKNERIWTYMGYASHMPPWIRHRFFSDFDFGNVWLMGQNQCKPFSPWNTFMRTKSRSWHRKDRKQEVCFSVEKNLSIEHIFLVLNRYCTRFPQVVLLNINYCKR